MKVLFASDGSPYATDAARFLRDMKFSEPLDVILFTASFDPQMSSTEVIQPWFPEWMEHERSRVERHHDELESLLTERCRSVAKLRHDGHAASLIVDEANRNAVDLIVMGAQGHSLIGRMLLGSVSDSVATHAKCSVLVVRPHDDDAVKQRPTLNITMAYDGSSASREAVNELLDLDWNKETEVSLISIAPIYDYLVGDGLSAAALANEQEFIEHMQNVGKEMSKQMAATLPKVDSRVEQHHHIGDAIVTAAEKNESDLIMLGDAGHSLLHDWILGSTTKYVLRHAPCSVWISRHHRKADQGTE